MGRADLHMHTTLSDGRDDPRALLEHCRLLDALDVIAVTDHDTLAGALRVAEVAARLPGSPDVVVGEEVTSADGHILGLYLSSPIARGLSAQATIEAIHEQGGLAVAAHPYWHSAGSWPHGVGDLITRLEFDAVEVLNAGFTPGMFWANRHAQVVNRELERASIGASDAHVKEAVGWGYTAFPGRTAADLRRAIEERATAAGRMPYGVVGIGRYLAWGLDRRPRPAIREIA